MINTYTYKNLTWIDIESPNRDEIKSIMDKYHFDPLVGEELLSPSAKPKIEAYEDFIFIVLNLPLSRHSHTGASRQELDFVIGKDFIITTRYDSIDPLHKFSRVFEVNSILDKSDMGKHAGLIFYYMMKKIYASLENELDALGDELNTTEANIFNGKEKEMVFDLSQINRGLLDFKQAIVHHREIWNGMALIAPRFFDKGFGEYIQSLSNEYQKISENARSQSELLNELRSTNDSLLTTKTNETVRFFTVMAFMTFPLVPLLQVLDLNSETNPFRHMEHEFWIVVGLTIVCILTMYSIFRYKKWL